MSGVPAYYAAFGAGKQLSTNHQQRYGLGLLWNQDMGAVLVTQSGSSTAAWGTQAEGAQQVYEAAGVNATYRVLNTAVQPKPGLLDLPPGALTITYPLGGQGEKKLEFRDDAIIVTIHHPGPFTEIVPLVQAGDDPPTGFALKIEGSASKSRVPTDTLVGGRRLSVARLEAKDTLTYRLQFTR